MAAIQLTMENFNQEVMESDKPVFIDFWASWCGPCQMMLPIIEELEKEVTNVKICKLNVDEVPELAEQYQVASIPTFLLIKNKEVSKRQEGAMPKPVLMKMFQE